MRDPRRVADGRWTGVRGWWGRRARRSDAFLVLEALEHLAHDRTPLERARVELAHAVRNALGVAGAAVYRRQTREDGWVLVATSGHLSAPSRLEAAPAVAVAGRDPLAPVPRDAPPGADRPPPTGWGACVAAPHATTLVALGRRADGRPLDGCDIRLASVVGLYLDLTEQAATHADTLRAREDDVRRLEHQLAAGALAAVEEIPTIGDFPDIIGQSAALHRALDLVEKVAASTSSVLITGETGTGKELVARAIHTRSARRTGPLISVNCPAIPHHLAESELFGHERGAFTDAIDARPGKFELADGGTIFLDEVAELPLPLQVKLLRVLQEREIQRLGSRKTRRLDIRVVAATNRNLRVDMPHAFREDLYYRLATVTIDMPALRERADDIPALATHFATAAATAAGKTIRGFTGRALAMLRTYHWPGNVRELRNVVDRAVLLCAGDTIRPEHLTGFDAHAADGHRLSHIVREEKVRRVRDALRQSNGNQAAAARLLGMSRSNFGRLLKSLGLKPGAGAAADGTGMREVG